MSIHKSNRDNDEQFFKYIYTIYIYFRLCLRLDLCCFANQLLADSLLTVTLRYLKSDVDKVRLGYEIKKILGGHFGPHNLNIGSIFKMSGGHGKKL